MKRKDSIPTRVHCRTRILQTGLLYVVQQALEQQINHKSNECSLGFRRTCAAVKTSCSTLDVALIRRRHFYNATKYARQSGGVGIQLFRSVCHF